MVPIPLSSDFGTYNVYQGDILLVSIIPAFHDFPSCQIGFKVDSEKE